MPPPPVSPPSPSGGSRLLLLLIWCYSWWLAVDLCRSGEGGFNKLRFGWLLPCFCLASMLFLSPLAGCGGEEGGRISEMWAYRGSCGTRDALMLWRGVRQLSMGGAPSRPWWMTEEQLLSTEAQIKRRRCFLLAGFLAFPLFSAGLGGEGDEGNQEKIEDGKRRQSWEAANSSTTSAASSCRLISKPVKYSGDSTSSVRPCSRTAPALNVSEEASGFVPTSTHGGGVAGLQLIGGKIDPYVAMILGDQVIKSKKNSQTTVTGLPEEPIWNQDFHMLVANPRKQKLCIQVKDSIGLTDITIGTVEVDLSSLKDTVPTDKIVTLYGGWGFFGKRSSGEVLLRLTYKAYVEDEEDEGVKTEYATGYISDEDVLDYVRIDSGAEQQGGLSGNERETFMDLLAALLVSEEFQGIVSSAETRISRDNEQVEQVKAGDGVTAGKTAVLGTGTVSGSPEDRALVWLAAITSVMLLVSSNIGGSGYFNP